MRGPRLPPRFYRLRALGALGLVGVLGAVGLGAVWVYGDGDPVGRGGVARALALGLPCGWAASAIGAHVALWLVRRMPAAVPIPAKVLYLALLVSIGAAFVVGLSAPPIAGVLLGAPGVTASELAASHARTFLAAGAFLGALALEVRRAFRQARSRGS